MVDLKENLLVVSLVTVIVVLLGMMYVGINPFISGATVDTVAADTTTDKVEETKTEIEPETTEETSEEVEEEIETPTWAIKLTDYPASVKAGSNFNMKWKVTSPGKVNISTNQIVYSKDSWTDTLGGRDTLKSTAYKVLISEMPAEAPKSFEKATKLDSSGTYYLRGYAIMGGINYWTPEVSIKAT